MKFRSHIKLKDRLFIVNTINLMTITDPKNSGSNFKL